MGEAAQSILLVIVTLFPIVDPLGGSPFFLALTREYSPEARKALSWRIAVNSFFLLVATNFVGTYVLAFFGISLPVVQVGGGLIVIATGSEGHRVISGPGIQLPRLRQLLLTATFQFLSRSQSYPTLKSRGAVEVTFHLGRHRSSPEGSSNLLYGVHPTPEQ
jgi:hypothetical protein